MSSLGERQNVDTSERRGRDRQLNSLAASDQAFIDERTSAIKQLIHRSVENVIEIGGLLRDVKEHLTHGDWLPWLEREFEWSDRTARNFMNVHEVFGKSETVSKLGLRPTVLYELASGRIPEDVRAQIVVRAAAGERITGAMVRAATREATARVAIARADALLESLRPVPATFTIPATIEEASAVLNEIGANMEAMEAMIAELEALTDADDGYPGQSWGGIDA